MFPITLFPITSFIKNLINVVSYHDVVQVALGQGTGQGRFGSLTVMGCWLRFVSWAAGWVRASVCWAGLGFGPLITVLGCRPIWLDRESGLRLVQLDRELMGRKVGLRGNLGLWFTGWIGCRPGFWFDGSFFLTEFRTIFDADLVSPLFVISDVFFRPFTSSSSLFASPYLSHKISWSLDIRLSRSHFLKNLVFGFPFSDGGDGDSWHVLALCGCILSRRGVFYLVCS